MFSLYRRPEKVYPFLEKMWEKISVEYEHEYFNEKLTEAKKRVKNGR